MMGLHSAQSQALPDLNLANLPFKIGPCASQLMPV